MMFVSVSFTSQQRRQRHIHHSVDGLGLPALGTKGGLVVRMRDVKESTPALTPFGLPAWENPRGLTNDSEVSSRGNKRISAMCGWWSWAS